jgi:hypothetical protein
MMTMRTAAVAFLIAGAGAMLAGCAGTTGDTAAPAGSAAASAASSADPSVPALPPGAVPSGAPKTPSDLGSPAGWIEGTVVRGGTGPCYGVLDLDGVEYAMYADADAGLTKGTRIRAKVSPTRLRIDCGSGKQVQASTVERLP